MAKCLITRPNHDKVTSYLFMWSKEILEESYPVMPIFLDLRGSDANREKVESYLKKQNPEFVLFNGHGTDSCICGFKDEMLIESKRNEELLKGRIVYSLSCSSAKVLGKDAIEKGTEAFIGYDNAFMLYTDSERETTPLKDNIAGSFLRSSNRLSISLLKGKTAEEASNRSKEEFGKEIRKYLALNPIEGADRIAVALLWDMNNQVVLGNEKASIG